MIEHSLGPDDDPVLTGEIPAGFAPEHIVDNVRSRQLSLQSSGARMPLQDLDGNKHDEDIDGIEIEHEPGAVVAFISSHKKGITYGVTVAALVAGVAGITWVKRRNRGEG